MKFIVQLICIVYPYPWSPRKPSFSQGNSLAPRQNNFQNPPLLFCQPTLFEDISTPRLESTKWLTFLITILVLQDQAQEYIFLYFYKLPRAFSVSLSLSRMLVEFSLKLKYSAMCGKNFQICGVHIPRKCVDSRDFYSCPSPLKAPPPSSCHHDLGRRKLLIPSASIF